MLLSVILNPNPEVAGLCVEVLDLLMPCFPEAVREGYDLYTVQEHPYCQKHHYIANLHDDDEYYFFEFRVSVDVVLRTTSHDVLFKLLGIMEKMSNLQAVPREGMSAYAQLAELLGLDL